MTSGPLTRDRIQTTARPSALLLQTALLVFPIRVRRPFRAGFRRRPRGTRAPAREPAHPGPARRTRARPVRRRRGDLEPAPDLGHAPAGGIRRQHQFRPRLHRRLRHPGQLRRRSDLGHLRPGQPGVGGQPCVPGLPERRLGVRAPAVRLGRGIRRKARLRRSGDRGGGEPRPPARHPYFRHHRRHRARVRRQRADLPRLPHAHRARAPRRRRERVRLRLRVGPGAARRGAAGLLRRAPRRGPQHGPLPHRGHQGAPGRSGQRRDRQLAPNLRGPGGAAHPWFGARRHRRHGGRPRAWRLRGQR